MAIKGDEPDSILLTEVIPKPRSVLLRTLPIFFLQVSGVGDMKMETLWHAEVFVWG